MLFFILPFFGCWVFLFLKLLTCLLVSFAGKETLRCLALALKWMPLSQQRLSYDDEKDLTFIGLVCFRFKGECKVQILFKLAYPL